METRYEFVTVKDIVVQLLHHEPRTRNDDKYLTFRVMQHFTKIYIPYEDFAKIPAFETVKRCRALIQNKHGKYRPTDPRVIERRNKRRGEVAIWATNT